MGDIMDIAAPAMSQLRIAAAMPAPLSRTPYWSVGVMASHSTNARTIQTAKPSTVIISKARQGLASKRDTNCVVPVTTETNARSVEYLVVTMIDWQPSDDTTSSRRQTVARRPRIPGARRGIL